MELSEKQMDFIVNSNQKLNFAHGAVRSGKTFCTLIRWAEFIKNCPDDDLAMIGYSLETVFYNAIVPFMSIFDGYCSCSGDRKVLTFGTKKIRIVGAHDQSAYRVIQGMTLSGVYCDEMTIFPQSFLDMLFSRLSKPHSKLFGTMNPDTPNHPLKQLIDDASNHNLYELKFELDDNPNLDDEYKKFVKGLYSGLWYKRYILGEWVQAEGAIYDSWDRRDHIVSRLPSPDYYIVGIDVGAANPFAAVLIGINYKSQPMIAVHKEYYWNPKETQRQKTNAEFADDLERFTYGYPVRAFYIDPAAESFEVELRKRKKVVKEADNDVFNGLSSVANHFAGRTLAIHESCTHLIKEIEGYVWDPKKTKLGEDAPLKVNDHLCDALRYAIYSHIGNRDLIGPQKQMDLSRGSVFKEGTGKSQNGWGWQTFSGGGAGGGIPGINGPRPFGR